MMIRKVFRYITDTDFRFKANAARGLYRNMQDEEYLKRMFKARMGYELNLNNPQTFNEKLQWLKLYDRKPIYTTMVDKYAAKQYISDLVGAQYVIPTYGVWERFDEINFDNLPDKFVLKTTHDSGGIVLCDSKSQFNYGLARRKLEKSLKNNYYYYGREWPYKDVKPRIIAEELLESSSGCEIRDYKLHCINGKVRFLYVTSDRFNGNGLKADYFDENFEKLDIQWGLPNSSYTMEKPKNFELMKKIAEKFSKDIAVLRVDFFEVDGRVYIGELTFYDGSGFAKINDDWDLKLGKMITLPRNI